MRPLRLGTRGSPLALWQARTVAERLDHAGNPACEIVAIKTSGDRLAEATVSESGGKRLFVKEIEEALLGGEIDLAVHSSKDLPVVLPDGLSIGAVLRRDDPRDAMVLPATAQCRVVSLEDLDRVFGPSPRVGTGSVRRVAQLTRLMPRARFSAVRGNLDTRLQKLDTLEYDALVLAAAGLRRLGLAHRISLALPVVECVPAPGQGAIAVEIRTDDPQTAHAVAFLDDAQTSAAVAAERSLVAALGGGCQMPIGALAIPLGWDLELHAVVVSPDGSRAVRSQARGPQSDAVALGTEVAQRLIEQGAREILGIRDEDWR